ncbi:MAG TPA: 4Fe-4S ferredoxin, partial [Clostridiales bacterium]|nr:4Fe-4S ferredoxin [Clostridiales bacterium]
GGHIHDAQGLIDLSHVKGHGACGYGGACKNLAMGCVTDRTRSQIHHLEGGLVWEEDKCTHCSLCIESCNHKANSFSKDGRYQVFYHNCTFCQHCVKVCPQRAIRLDADRFDDFQTGMAICTEEILHCFPRDHVFYINFLTQITAVCDCWGLTTSSVVPDIGIMASRDLVAIERASIDAIRFENVLMNGIPKGHVLGNEGHLFQRLHNKDPYIQLNALEKRGLGRQEYELLAVK